MIAIAIALLIGWVICEIADSTVKEGCNAWA